MGEDSRIWIGGLPEKISDDEIKEEFLRFGDVKHVRIRHNQGRCSFAFVQFSNRDEAKEAMRETDQQKLFGMPFVKVAWAGVAARRNKGDGKGRPDRSESPGRRSRSHRPRRRSGSGRRSASGRRRSPTPHRRSPMSQKRRSRSRSPQPRRSQSPRGRGPGPRRSPSPGRSLSRRRSPSRRRDSPRKDRSPIRRRKAYTVVVEHLPSDMTQSELQDIAGDFVMAGHCAGVRVDRGKGVGEIDFTNDEDMVRVIKELDKRRLAGSNERLKAYAK